MKKECNRKECLMPDIKAVFAEEIKRLVRKEIRSTIVSMGEQITSLKKMVEDLNVKIKELETASAVSPGCDRIEKYPEGSPEKDPAKKTKISGRKLIKFRHKLGLTQTELAKLLNVTTLTVSNWELEKNRIRESICGRITQLCSMESGQLEQLIAEKLPEHNRNFRQKKRLIRVAKDKNKSPHDENPIEKISD